jgi:NodT family efflux transporter outer membrane factor (OMF) lipoprotein
MLHKIILSGVTAALLGGCAANVPSPETAIGTLKSDIASPAHYQSSYVGGKVRDNWLRLFRDPTLNRLVKEAQQHNPNLQIAASRVARAAAILNYTESTLYPHLDLQGSYQFRSWEAQEHHDKGTLSLAINWEPDLWGRIGNQQAADYASLAAQKADFAYARESLSANTAKTWFLLSSDRMIHTFTKEIVTLQSQAVDILQKRAEIGEGNMRDVHMIRGMLAEAKEMERTALQAKQRDTRALEILIGRYPANAIRSSNLGHLPAAVPSGVPADLLNRRPDVIAAQYRVASAFHNIKAAELLRLPAISLSLQGGVDVLQDTMAKAIGGLFMPLLDAGAIQSQIDAATADQQAAIANYRRTVLNAFSEVENALAKEKQLAQRYRYLNTMVKEFKTAYKMTDENYKIGQGTLLDVLQIQSKWINARIARVTLQQKRLINRVNLYLALGGSYTVHTTDTKAP